MTFLLQAGVSSKGVLDSVPPPARLQDREEPREDGEPPSLHCRWPPRFSTLKRSGKRLQVFDSSKFNTSCNWIAEGSNPSDVTQETGQASMVDNF